MQKLARARPLKVSRTVSKNKGFKSNFDPDGSYTGVVKDDQYEKPVQDADDL